MGNKVFFVVAAYNVENIIASVIESLLQKGYTDIVVVDDGSQDETLAQINPYRTRVHLIEHMINRGQGAALQTGTTYALAHGADIIVHFDGDGQMRAEDVPAMLAPIERGEADVVLGSRYLGEGNNIPALKRYVYFPIGRIVNFIFTGLWLSDVHCGFRALSRAAAQEVMIRQDRMAHATEILEKIGHEKLLHKEVAVTIEYHHFGQGLFDGIRIFWDLLKTKLLK